VSPSSARTVITFASAARRYWFGVFPIVQSELHRLRKRARRIPDPVLRALALDAQQHKWDCLEGAAAFATFVARGQRARLARLFVDLQALLDYADTLMEQPSNTPVANARRLHNAFATALHHDLPRHDYYQHNARKEDGGYLVGLVDSCRASICTLPSYAVVADVVMHHAGRMTFYQSEVNLATKRDYPSLMRWASRQPAGAMLNWWEIGAACGSSLAVFAHIAAASDPRLMPCEVDAIEALYWPWAAALHILLDSLIDRAEDRETHQHNLIDHYSSQEEMTERLAFLASETAMRADEVPPGHRLILAGMVALYLSDEQAWTAFARPATERILAATDTLAKPALILLRARRLALRAGRELLAPSPER
jgi:tetraprenyl-beta-curcumene synthase